MFVDKVDVTVKAGDGGDGRLSFRTEKYVDKGGPDGGNGGRGGNVVAVASNNQDTLATYRYQKQIKAPSGRPGDERKKNGRGGEDLEISVPVGTVVTNEDGTVLADLVEVGAKAIIAKGGDGGFGNAHFKSSVRQAPRVAEKGELGDELTVTFELKMIADIGLVGLPNAGKSTLLASVSNARPEIANYPFTTLKPNLGMVKVGKTKDLLVADIPGLIEGASTGKGLGDEFLRHVERTSVLVHLIDIYNDDVAEAYKVIQKELKDYEIDLADKPQLIALNKIEGFDDEIIEDKIAQLKKVAPKNAQIFAISAQAKKGIDELMRAANKLAQSERKRLVEEQKNTLPVLTYEAPEHQWRVVKKNNKFVVTGKKIERFARRTDTEDFHGDQRLRDIMRKMGIMSELKKQGAQAEQRIIIGSPSIAELLY